MLPFSSGQFIDVFVSYGRAVWPMQIVAVALGLAAVAALSVRGRRTDAFILCILAAMWAATGAGYHMLFFTKINTAAWLFGALFVVQAIGFACAAIFCTGLKFGLRRDASGLLGAGLLLYAAILYPVIGFATGHSYFEIPAFGITPCPVALFTFGLLLLTVSPVPGWLLVIPVLWSLVGGTAAFLLQVPQDWVLLFSGAATIMVLYFRGPRPGPTGSSQF